MSSGKNPGSRMEDDSGSTVPSEHTFVFGAEVVYVEDSVENERTQLLNSQDGEIVVDSDDEEDGVDGTEDVGVRNDGLSCHRIEKRQQACTGYLLRNCRRGFMQSARKCPLTDWERKEDPYSMLGVTNCQGQTFNKYNTLALAENEALVDSRNKVNMDIDRQNRTVSKGTEDTKSRDTVKGILSRDEPDDNKVIPRNDSPVVTSGHELARLCDIESQEPEDSSQSNALDFIDRYLSSENLNLSEEDSTTKSSKIIYPPIFNAKGRQSLARRANLIAARESGAFDWDEDQTGEGECLFGRKGKQLIQGFESETISLHRDPDFQKCSSIQPVQNLPGNILSMEKPGPRTMPDDVGNVPLISEMVVETNMENMLDGELDVGSLELQLENDKDASNVADWLDVGFETQLAAEAMEALLHASPNNKSSYHHGGSSDIAEKSSEVGATNCRSRNGTTFNGIFPKSRVSGRRSKRSAKRRNENITRSLLKCGQHQGESISSVAAGKKGKDNGPSTETNIVYDEYCTQSCSSTHKSKQRKSSPETNNFKKIVNNRTLSKSDSPNRGILGGNLWNFSVATKRKRCQPSNRSWRGCQDPAKPSEDTLESILEFKVSKKRKEASCLSDEDQKKLKTKGNRSKLVSDSSSEVTESNKKGVQNYPDTISTASLLQLDCWSYPKKKRTPVSFKCPSSGSIPRLTPSEVVEEKIKMQPNENNKPVKRISGSLLVYTRRLKSTSEKKYSKTLSNQNSSARSSLGVKVSTSTVPSGCIIIAKLCKENSQHSSESDNMTSLHTIHNSENMKFVEESGDDSRAQTNYRENVERKLTRKKNLGSLLRKELSRLGYADTLPDFMPKSSRRRRGVANICALFSQNIDATTIRQQKKILARLGFSEASHCSDATHFIADKFVRSRNMLEAIALGKPVVTPSWLESCGQAGYLIDERSYILTDAKKEKEIGFSMSVSLAHARQHPLLHGQRVLITPNVKPNKDLIQSLVNAVHGEVVPEIQQDGVKYNTIPQDMLILSCDEDYAMCEPFLEKGAAIYSSELLLDGIITQKLQYKSKIQASALHKFLWEELKRQCLVAE